MRSLSTGVPRTAAGGALLAALLLLATHAPAFSADSAVILQYHHFGAGTPVSTSVTMDQFRSHLNYLRSGGFTVWPVEKIVARLQGGEPLPERCVGITIDDAYTSVYERAFPVLREYGFPFTVFVTTEGVDKGFESYMTWNQMREMLSAGAAFGAHGHSHDYLVRKRAGETGGEWAERVRGDIALSVTRLREETGISPPLFAYPYGEYDTALKRIVAGLGLAGFAQQSGPLWKGSDFAALPRFPMAAEYANLAQFAVKAQSLPLPVVSALPDDPVLLSGDSPPVLRLTLEPGDYARETLTCFGAAGAVIHASWEGPSLQITSPEPLPAGRSKYTCTARHLSENRYYWYSHLWIREEVR
jgi:peptidoglycan/xylan/chitin deacetylase (PgdA/CDA1 family)